SVSARGIPHCAAKASTCSFVGEATATTSAFGTRSNASACRLEINCDPIKPTLTLSIWLLRVPATPHDVQVPPLLLLPAPHASVSYRYRDIRTVVASAGDTETNRERRGKA